MNVGDLVRLSQISKCLGPTRIGLIVEVASSNIELLDLCSYFVIPAHQYRQGGFLEIPIAVILYPSGLEWEYIIDLEMINGCR